MTVDLVCVNDPPVAFDDADDGRRGRDVGAADLGAGSPAENDTDADGDTLTVTAVDNPVGGTVSIVGDEIEFAPTANLCGVGAGGFEYTVDDDNGGTDVGLVTVDIVCVNDPPVAFDDAETVGEDETLVLPTSGPDSPAENDTDADGDTLTVTAVDNPVGGTVSIVGG